MKKTSKKIGPFLYNYWLSYVVIVLVLVGIHLGDADAVEKFYELSFNHFLETFYSLIGWLLPLAIAIPLTKNPWPKTRTLVAEIIAFIILPLWGLWLNQKLAANCDYCDDFGSRILISPDIFSLYVIYFLSVAAYFLTRYKKKLGQILYVFSLAFLLIGISLSLTLTIHFGVDVFLGIFFPAMGLPLVAPFWTLLLFLMELRKQSKTEKFNRLFLSLAFPLMSLWFLIHKIIFLKWPWTIFTETCGWALSLKTAPPRDCHYLCTVAARGHPAIVKPLRLGTRHGQPIIVNRQLQIANAFEDLLHELFPRFGKWCRKTYDKFGLPISALISKQGLANLVYVLMKPFEWLFYFFLVLFDPQDPEKRIDRMYR